jgi:hypothetical protein
VRNAYKSLEDLRHRNLLKDLRIHGRMLFQFMLKITCVGEWIGYNWLKIWTSKMVQFNIEQAMNVKRGSRGVALLFL